MNKEQFLNLVNELRVVNDKLEKLDCEYDFLVWEEGTDEAIEKNLELSRKYRTIRDNLYEKIKEARMKVPRKTLDEWIEEDKRTRALP